MTQTTIRTAAELAVWSLILWVVYRKVQFYFFPPGPALSRYRRGPKNYALVTGASAGLGYAYAQELITHGFNVILVASRKDRLEAAAQRLRAENTNVSVLTIVYDAQDVDADHMSSAFSSVMNLPITVLVNNVGGFGSHPQFQSLLEHSPQQLTDVINVNAGFAAHLTRLLLPVLKQHGPSLVINMSSVVSWGAAWFLPYASGKAFVNTFSISLSRESNALGWGIDSLAIVAGDVQTEFNSEGLPPGSPTAREYAKIVLDRAEMAVDRSMWVVSPYWLHAVQGAVFELLPERLKQKLLVDTVKKQKILQAKKQ